MKAKDERRRRQLLGGGAALCAIGAVGIIMPLIVGLPDVIDAVAFPAGFLVGLVAGLGAMLTLLNLKAPS